MRSTIRLVSVLCIRWIEVAARRFMPSRGIAGSSFVDVKRDPLTRWQSRNLNLDQDTVGCTRQNLEHLWRDELRGLDVTVIAGAAVIHRDGYDNVMVAISAGESRILYRERMPVPVSMWQPWLAWAGQGGGAQAHMFANPVVKFEGARVAPLICYEQLILWLVLHSMLHSPDIIVATGNGWWTAGTSIVAIQKTNVAAWARLFGLPLVMAFNT